MIAIKKLRETRVYGLIEAMVGQYFRNAVGRTGAELAYFLLFSIFPILIFANAIIGKLHLNLQLINETVSKMFPTQISSLISYYLNYVSGMNSRPFVITGIFLCLYSIYRVVNAIFYAINKNYQNHGKASLRRVMFAIIFTIALVLSICMLFVVLATGTNFMAWLAKYVTIPHAVRSLWKYLRFILLAAILFCTMLAAYWLAPYERIKIRQAIPGTIFSMVVLTLLTMGFSFYVDNISNYSVLYGSLGTIMLLLFWLYIIGTIIVLGGEMNFVIIEMKGYERR